MLSNIEKAREYIGGMTLGELEENELILDAVLRRLENASEAYSRLCDGKRGSPELAKEIEGRHPSVPWRQFQSLANRYRHDYDLTDVNLVWQVLQPAGTATQVEAAIRQELPLAQ